VLLEKASDIVPVIQHLLADKSKYEAMREATIGLSMPNSTERIVREIAALLPVSLSNEDDAVVTVQAA
jgi:UDP-N-acetylglucosamine 2-epimerase